MLLLYTMGEHSRCQDLILIHFLTFTADFHVLLHVAAEISIQFISLRFHNMIFFYGVVLLASHLTPTLSAKVSLFVCHHP